MADHTGLTTEVRFTHRTSLLPASGLASGNVRPCGPLNCAAAPVPSVTFAASPPPGRAPLLVAVASVVGAPLECTHVILSNIASHSHTRAAQADVGTRSTFTHTQASRRRSRRVWVAGVRVGVRIAFCMATQVCGPPTAPSFIAPVCVYICMCMCVCSGPPPRPHSRCGWCARYTSIPLRRLPPSAPSPLLCGACFARIH